jgi:hypothetical protein
VPEPRADPKRRGLVGEEVPIAVPVDVVRAGQCRELLCILGTLHPAQRSSLRRRGSIMVTIVGLFGKHTLEELRAFLLADGTHDQADFFAREYPPWSCSGELCVKTALGQLKTHQRGAAPPCVFGRVQGAGPFCSAAKSAIRP